jgi:hypothetical protein
MEEVFGGVYGLKYLGRDSCTVGDPGRKTGERRFVPYRQAQASGEFADFRFGKSCLNKRTSYGELKGRASARAMVAEIVGVRAVEHEGDAFLLRDTGKLTEQFPLAVVASVRGITEEFF